MIGITKTTVLQALNNLMGRRQMPGGTSSDLERYCQTAFDYAWRYYPWDFSKRRVSLDLTTGNLLPADFDLFGYHSIVSTPGNEWTEVSMEDYDLQPSGWRYYTLEYDSASGRYAVITSFSVSVVTFIYQIAPPTLSADVVPFPSSMSIAIGAAIWAKQGENPNSADVSQEWDEFHVELDRHVGRAENHKPRHRPRNRHDVAGTYTGDSRY